MVFAVGVPRGTTKVVRPIRKKKLMIEVARGNSLKFGHSYGIKEDLVTGLDLTTNPSSSWTIEQTVRISLGKSSRTDLHLEVDAFTDGHKLRSRQGVFFFVNGSFVGFGTFIGAHRLRFPLPGIFLRAASNELHMALPDAASPKQLGIGTDERVLGIALVEIVFS